MKAKNLIKTIAVIPAILLSMSHVSAVSISSEDELFFENKIRPVLAESCYQCHNSVSKRKVGLALDWRDGWVAGSDNGAVIIPGDPENSLLIKAIRHDNKDLQMPFKLIGN